MGFWFFLAVVVVANLFFKAYRLRIATGASRVADDRVLALELELKAIREKIQHLDEAVFFGDFELKRQFNHLEREMANKR